MYCHDRLKPAICRFDQFDQAVELRRLGEFADQVSAPEVREYINSNLVYAHLDWTCQDDGMVCAKQQRDGRDSACLR
jgi:hypothetical protein